jgi:hypothetical protein
MPAPPEDIMKRTTAILGTLFSIALAVRAFASESFTLNIPLRGDASQEIGEVHITLGLDGPPSGAQLVVNGTTTLNLGQTVTVGTDSVTFTPATNAVRIVYQPRSNFGADFCAGGSAVEKNIPMRFAGPQDATEYRMSSFVVAAPSVECSQPSKRIADTPATIIPVGDGVAPALTATNRGRLPLDVVLVLDKSGSMAALPPGAGGGATKVQILDSAVKAFVANWREIDQPTPGGGDWSEDRIGVVFFDNNVAAQTLAGADPPANFFVQRGSSTVPGPWDAVLADIDTLTPGGNTSIGGGVNEGMKQWKADPANDLSIVLVTDGIQNTAPLIQLNAAGHLELLPVSGLSQELRKRFIPIQTIGFGTPATVDEDLLRNIALETAGRSYMSANAATAFDTFAMTLVSILKGNTASLAARHRGKITGPGPSALQSVSVDRSAQRVVFSLQWAPPLIDALDLEVFPPSAATPASAEKIPQASIQSFNVTPADVGTWKVRVKRNKSSKAAVEYSLNVFFLERDLDYQLSFDTIRPATGDNIRLRAALSHGGKPLTRLPAGAIRVRIQRPTEGLGTILHNTKLTDKAGSATASSGEPQTPYHRKLARIADKELLARILPKDVDVISLQEEGRGVYAGTFGKTSTPGSYGFEVLLDWDDARTGRVRREERLEHYVRVKPDAAKSAITTSKGAGGTLLISVTPRDKFGNYIGPGYESVVRAKLYSAGSLVGPPVDRDHTGTYVFTVTGVPAGETPNADITVDGVVVGNPAFQD